MAEGRIFISYRRGHDTAAVASLRDQLALHFDDDRLVFHIDAIPLGRHFEEYLHEQVASCDVFLAVIGTGWVEACYRFMDKDDFVRIEIEAALQRPHIPIIPVFIDGAAFPGRENLPERLQPLRRRNGLNLRHDSFVADVDRRLKPGLDRLLDDLGSREAGPASSPEPQVMAKPLRAEAAARTRLKVDEIKAGRQRSTGNSVTTELGYSKVSSDTDGSAASSKRPEIAENTQFHDSRKSIEIDQPPKLFLSYSREDQFWRQQFEDMLNPLLRRKSIELWSDRKIEEGNWRSQIDDAMSDARAALFLVSTNSLKSDFIMEIELPTLLQAAEERNLPTLWVPLDHAFWEETNLSDQTAATDPKLPLSEMTPAQQNRAIKQICLRVRGLLLRSVSLKSH